MVRNKDNVGKKKRSQIVVDRMKALKRQRRARSGGKRKRSLKDEPKEDGCGGETHVIRFYDSSWSEHKRVPATEIPMPRLKELAAKLVDFYSKREALDFELVEVVKGFSVVRDDTLWQHLNFKAKIKDPQPTVQSSDVKFFFGELEGEHIDICCIIDPNARHVRTVCDVCDGKEQIILHPICGTESMLALPASSEIDFEPADGSIYERELRKAGGSVEKANEAYRYWLHRTYAVMAGF